jgi:hypothetical protein
VSRSQPTFILHARLYVHMVGFPSLLVCIIENVLIYFACVPMLDSIHVHMNTCIHVSHALVMHAPCTHMFVFLSRCWLHRTHAYTRVCVRSCVRMRALCLFVKIHTHVRACKHTYIHTYIHIYISTCTHYSKMWSFVHVIHLTAIFNINEARNMFFNSLCTAYIWNSVGTVGESFITFCKFQ